MAIKINIDKDVPKYIKADETKINQVLTNLMSNAAKFTEEGEITIKASISNQNKVMISVADSGVGIGREDLGKLFQKFTQLNTPTKRKHKGTGLGLNICHHLVELMGGKINVTSERFKGSTFYFTFEFEKVEQDGSEEAHYEDYPSAGCSYFDAHVLLVEDNQVNIQVASLMLKKYGCKVDVAENGLIAIKKVAYNHYDLILMDIQMPIMGGIETTKILKDKFSDVAPIVGLSANAMEGDAENFMQSGLDDYITKPITSNTLLKKLNKWLNIAETKKTKVFETIKKASGITDAIEQMNIINEEVYNDIRKVSAESNLINEIYGSFFVDAENLIKECAHAFETNDYKQLQRAVHTLKGLCGTVGATQMFELNKIINHQLNTSIYKNIDHAIEKLSFYLDRFKVYIEKEKNIKI